ncbi:MAG: hypothetical protein KC635_18640 [Myxococcales bacterium]|nr:hypothetical protein [Myxococcales bacterium]MCB9737306.1 hypothetical protein [Deltaproteobacteria bacterium]
MLLRHVILSVLTLAAGAVACEPYLEAAPVTLVDPSLHISICNENPSTLTLWVSVDVVNRYGDDPVTVESIEIVGSEYVSGEATLPAPAVVEPSKQVTVSCVNGFTMAAPPAGTTSSPASIKVTYRAGGAERSVSMSAPLVRDTTFDNCQNVIGETTACHGE